jgi:iron transport multicopper oxidase
MHTFKPLLCLSLLAMMVSFAHSDTHVYNFVLSYVWAGPDGFFKAVIHINNQFPGPLINVTEGDTVIVNVQNELWNEATSIHWHGLFMQDSPDMDGSPLLTQSFIPPFASYTYKFNVNQSGTYWYHSHNWYQTGDGLFGPLIVNRKVEPLDPCTTKR